MKRVLILLGAIFVVALAIVVGSRMSSDAMAVVVGVTCGVVASIPTSLLIIWATSRRDVELDAGGRRYAPMGMGNQFPPVVVVNPGGSTVNRPDYGARGLYPYDPQEMYLPAPRGFKVVGEAETSSDGNSQTWQRLG